MVMSMTRTGHLHRMLPDGRVETICPSGKTLQYVPKIPGSDPPVSPPSPVELPIPDEKLGGSNAQWAGGGLQKSKSTVGKTGALGHGRSHAASPPQPEVSEPPSPPLPTPPKEPVLMLEEEEIKTEDGKNPAPKV